jgi:hypothetical protein
MTNVIQFPQRKPPPAVAESKHSAIINQLVMSMIKLIAALDGYANELERQDMLHLLGYYDRQIERAQARIDFIMEMATNELAKRNQ